MLNVDAECQCPMPNAQCPMPSAQCPMPNGQWSMVNAACPCPCRMSHVHVRPPHIIREFFFGIIGLSRLSNNNGAMGLKSTITFNLNFLFMLMLILLNAYLEYSILVLFIKNSRNISGIISGIIIGNGKKNTGIE